MKILIIIGTRPEVIKLAPIIEKLRKIKDIKSKICITGQHKDMIKPFLKLFLIRPDYNLNVTEYIKYNQSLSTITCEILKRLDRILKKEKPNLIIIQGDTLSAFTGALCAFYNKVPIAYVESGLRTYKKYQPFPEEINRRLITNLADLHFAPTKRAKQNLLLENIPKDKIFVTGNTIIDSLIKILKKTKYLKPFNNLPLLRNKRIVLFTMHRRESFGKGIKNVCNAIRKITKRINDIQVVCPLHFNPNVRMVIKKELKNTERVILLEEPLDYITFIHLMNTSYLIITDSGGIQEEAPYLGKPVLLTRKETERTETIEKGTAKIVSTEVKKIVQEAITLLSRKELYKKMAKIHYPFGDGKASTRIVAIIKEYLLNRNNKSVVEGKDNL